MAISKDKKTLVRAWHPRYSIQTEATEPVVREVNSHAVKAITKASSIDLESSVENPLEQWYDELKRSSRSGTTAKKHFQVLDLYDAQVKSYSRPPLSGLPQGLDSFKLNIEYSMLNRFPGTDNGLHLTRVLDGDDCPKCRQGVLNTQNTVELGHTFHLGTRYSEILNASVAVESSMLDTMNTSHAGNQIVPMQMGCHGIGVSRMISAVADVLSDSRGLNWPRAIAPFEVVVVPAKGLESEAERVYDTLTSDKIAPIDAVLDDRDKQIGWKLGDADLIGYPVIIVVGKGWKQKQELEVQCRRLNGLREQVPIDRLADFVKSLLDKL
jgi:prolyl-tRNA synthetase